MPRVTTETPIALLVPPEALSVSSGEATVDLGALPPSGITSDDVANDSALDPSPGTLTEALDGVEVRLLALEGGVAEAAVLAPQVVTVRSASDLPAAVAGVRTLADDTMYWVLGSVDIGADRLQVPDHCAIFGIGAVQSSLRSNNPSPLVTSRRLILRDVALINPGGPSVRISGNVPGDTGAVLRADACMFVGNSTDGVVQAHDLDLTAVTTCRFTASTGVGLRVTGSCRTVFASSCISQSNAAGFTTVQVPPGAVVSGRAIITGVSSDLGNGGVGVDASAAAFQPQGLTVSQCTFPDPTTPGVGQPVAGVTADSTRAFFLGNQNLENSHVRGGLSIANNAAATTVSNTTDYFPLAGTTTLQAAILFDSPAAGKLRYIGTGTIRAKVITYVTLVTSNPSQDLEILFAITPDGGAAVNVTEFVQEDVTDGTTLRTGIMPLMAWVSLSSGDVLDVRVRNKTAANNVTWRHGQVYAEQING